MAFANRRYHLGTLGVRALRGCTLLAVAGLLSLFFSLPVSAQDIRTQEIDFDDNAATTATRNTLTLRGPLDDSLTIDYSLLLPNQSGLGVGSLLYVDSYAAATGTTRWLAASPNAVLTTDASGNLVWGAVSSLITSAGEFADADTIGMDGFVYARQALEVGTPDTVVVTDEGAFGIGTTTPDAWITVQANNDLFRAKDISGNLRSVLTDEGEQNWFLGNPAGDFGQGRVGTIGSYPAFSLFRPGSSDQFNILNRSTYTGIGYSADGSDTGSVLSIAQGGNVGIGLAAPQNKLHVSASSDPLRLDGLQSAGRMDSVLVVDAQGVVYWTPADSLIRYWIDSAFVSEPAWLLEGNSGTDPTVNFLGTTDSVDLVFRANNAEAGRITAGGNVGVGTSAPQNRLHVSATSDPLRLDGTQQIIGLDSVMVLDGQGVVHWAPADSLIRYWIDSAFVSEPAWLLEGNSGTDPSVNFLGTIDSVDLVFRTNSLEAGRVTADGNLGVGTSTPQNRLHVSATSDPLRLDGTQQIIGLDSVMVLDGQGVVHWAPADSLIRYWIDSAFVSEPAWLLEGNSGTDPSVNFLGTIDSVDLVFRTNSVEAGRVTAEGNLGVGTSTPQNRLHVSATSDPLRLDGTQQKIGLDSVMVLDGQGVVHWAPADSLIRYLIDSAFVAPNAWLLDGNAGTNSTTNYVGTSDLQNLSIRANAVEHIVLDATTGETTVTNAPTAAGSWNALNTTLDMATGGSRLNGGATSNNSLLLAGGGSIGSADVISSNIDIQAAGTFAGLYGVHTNLTFPSTAILPSTIASFSGNSVDLTNGGALTSIATFYGYRVRTTGNPRILDGWGLHLASPGSLTVDYTGIEVEDLGNASGITRAFFYDGTGSNAPVVVTGAGTVGVGTATPSQAVEVLDGNLLLSNSGTAGQIQFAEPSGSGTNISSFEARAQLNDINYILPDTAGASGDVLTVQSIVGTTVTLDWGEGIPPDAWLLEGNSGTTAGTNFLGTIDNQPLELKVNSERVMRFEPTSTSPNILGGYFGNTIASGQAGNVIAGGGASGLLNQIGTGVDFGVIGGGRDNTITGGATDGVIVGGRDNTISSGATYSTIAGGRGLTLQGPGSFGFLGGNSSGSNNMTIADTNVALLGNVNLWMANNNNDSIASSIRFYEPNDSVGNFPAGINYTSLRSQAQTADIEYVFPDTAGVVGDVLAVRSVSGSNVILDWQSRNEGDGVGRLLFARKTSDETVTAGSTPAVQNDDELFLPLGTNRTYEISGALYMKRSSGTGSFDIAFDVPSGCVMLISFFANESKSGNSNTGADIRDIDGVGALANTNYRLVGLNTNWNVIHFKGLVVTGNTSGNIRVMWSPDGGTGTVYTNSYIGAKVAEN